MSKIIKEVIIMLFVCLFTILALSIGLYKFVPSKKNIPEITTYISTEDIKDLLEDDIDTREENKDPVLTYEITVAELKSYQKANEYVPGKANPFEAYTPTVTEEEVENGVNPDGEGENTTNDGNITEDSSMTDALKNEVKTNFQNRSTK